MLVGRLFGECPRINSPLVFSQVCEIGLHSPHLLNLIDKCPSGAETLVTRMLHVLTDPRTAFGQHLQKKPSPSAAAAAEGGGGVKATDTAAASNSVSATYNIPIMPPAALVDRVRHMYATRVHDVRCLIPVLVGLTKQEIIAALPKLVQLHEKVVKDVISRLLHGRPPQPPPLCYSNLPICGFPVYADIAST